MSGIKDQENIDELRKRLYDRGWQDKSVKRHDLTKTSIDVKRGWGSEVASQIPAKENISTHDNPPVTQLPPNESESIVSQISDTIIQNDKDVVVPPPKKNRTYRTIILLFSLGVLLLSVIGSAIYILLGGNQISANNISISIEAPFSVAGGDTVPIQVGITNQNSIPIESATLILNYPPGTKSVEEGNRDLYEDRLPLEDIEAGGVVNKPIKVIMFGEENEDKEIKATIEYRVKNSNGTFYKNAEPVMVKINSSPIVIRTEAVEKISSGQELEVTLTLLSNAINPMHDVLITADYPNSFSFLNAVPQTTYGQNSWLLDEVLPDTVYTITFKGLVTGLASEAAEIQLKAGTPKSDNQTELSSVLTQTKVGYTIENPFIDVTVGIGGDRDGAAVLAAGADANVEVLVANTMNETLYDMRVELVPRGNLIRDDNLDISSGFYDSVTKKINWEIAGMKSLTEVPPGESRKFSFTVKPDKGQSTGSFDLSVKVFARRVNEANANENLVGTAVAEAKYSSEIQIAGEINHTSSPFGDGGPVPPVAGQTTDYTITLVATAGVNDISGGVVTTALPQYVSWAERTSGDGEIEFNPVSKQISWRVGNMSAHQQKQIKMQIKLLPSVTHIGKTLTLLEAQDFRATDRFTEVGLKARAIKLDNNLSEELGFSEGNGRVQAE
ncbi:MAG: hypothetical protein H6779_02035 [Candidatus Nomurabacteria bacterium]|nr:hypothetical protein [Candidatus Nomurabacteria bacterium]USN88204.1 MAG: hypothetical protein H6779_02035 [Candidatus Nomurabacteria bacterium]